MSEYSFRGKPITGPHALVLVKAWEVVQEACLTREDIPTLQCIVDDFAKKFEEGLQRQEAEIDRMLAEED